MKQLIKLSLVSSLVLSNSVFALNPVLGFYGGLLGQVSRGNTNTDFTFISDGVTYSGKLKYNPVGGGGGFDLGYKIHNFRIEGEILYNFNNYDQLNINGCNILSPTVDTPTGTCPAEFVDAGLGFNGTTSVIFGMINAYYDIFTSDSESTFVPYIGFGIGKARVSNVDKFYSTAIGIEESHTRTRNASAAQVILGASYYMDDYTWASIDYRYLSTNTINDFNNKRYGLNTLNFGVNFAFSKG